MTETAAAATIRAVLGDAGLGWEESEPGTFVVTLPGTHKLKTTCSLAVGDHSVSVNAFVIRAPEENQAATYRWLLDRNRKAYGVYFAIDQLGDVYLVGHIPADSVTAAEVDRVLGSVVEYADGSFDKLLELGFADAIRREWAWRVSRGESLANLQAFRHLTE
ncbi:MAG: YbjN domain-containing protein [Streptosporangiales bacterium]|nr:YbjN domain-containing protein [Streptosporangiales bacterium]